MSIDQWLASTGAAGLVPVGILLGVLAGVLSERDVDPEGTADSGLVASSSGEVGQPARWVPGLTSWRRLVVSLLAICVCLLLISAVARFAVFM